MATSPSTRKPSSKHGKVSSPPSSSSPLGSTGLCRVCANIDFDRYLGEKIKDPISLAAWYSISQNLLCPFCRLVTHCVETNPRLSPSPHGSQIFLQNELSWKLGIEPSPYDRTKSESYSNKFDLRSMAKSLFSDAYRFTITVVEENENKSDNEDGNENENDDENDNQNELAGPKLQGIIQYLGHKERSKRDQQFFGRLVDPDSVNIDLLLHWLLTCSEGHSEACETIKRGNRIHATPRSRSRSRSRESSGSSEYSIDSDDSQEDLPASLRLIDVKQRCVVKAKELDRDREYVALSYVWGKAEMIRETGMKPVVLQRKMIVHTPEGECTPLPKRLPRTIEDVMTLSHLLGYRYLWIDALCIVQDDTIEEKIPHLTNMKAIYSQASLTIVAAAGAHVDHGLPGISAARKVKQRSEVVKSLRLATMFPSFSELENSSELLWNTRGWTFQEKLLSKRILLFTEYQVYFKCSESIWTEEIVLETGRISKSVEARPRKYCWQPDRARGAGNTRASVLKYFNPQLQVEDAWEYLGGFLDYAAAVHGILETMEDVTGKFICGLPGNHFLESLLWYPEIGSLQHYNHEANLPSWTWASYTFERKGASFELMDVRQLRTLIDMSRRAFPTAERNESTSRQKKKNDNDVNYIGLMGMYANLAACFTWPILQKDHTIRYLYYCSGASATNRIETNLPFSTLNLPGLPEVREVYFKSGNSNWRPSPDSLPPDQQVLTFQTSVVRFRIGRPVYSRLAPSDSEVGVFEVLSYEGECVGEVITTYGRARRGHRGSGRDDFLTISWGLSLQYAKIHPAYIPRWRFNSKADKKSFRARWNDKDDRGLIHLIKNEVGLGPAASQFVQRYSQYMPKALLLNLEPKKDPSRLTGGSQLCHRLYFAKKGQARPRSLWSVVNLILVDWEDNTSTKNRLVARRAGVGKVIMTAWQEEWVRSPPRGVVFG
ncbi:hypothetical protein LTR99_005765 [Exophiala xenobiotica]|uniref:Heterokaryon incompatibility domain-containing protein n=1 Tax=Vermiconidia calcicola TaxID=1690605 RepID=A0AAV9QHK8_9PEZI|nr:hypothetical protein LTR96_004883 [Exophiala xenobiotica]KAK5541161.1 hypothetical protein LTR25_002938 [Vermiconidia calcicola]KAK5549346.1 hypothetical protein LTR23_000454 [Chaetothyriales sp. CCFEE 6169]KAK5302808.1 hypothetical protein LTR99_005765 [Exophiala xenobiotica]KAK5340502.1 hypothetical protein LTR98_003624 [Exophiala xenobiotica]